MYKKYIIYFAMLLSILAGGIGRAEVPAVSETKSTVAAPATTDHDLRRQRGLDVIGTLTGTDDPEAFGK